MKKNITLLLLFCIGVFSMNAQSVVYSHDFEKAPNVNVKNLQHKLATWNKAQWKVVEKPGDGANGSNKYVACGPEENATLVLYRKLEVGATYVMSVDVRVAGVKKSSYKTNFTIKATSGKKGDMHMYAKDEVKEATPNEWTHHEIEFTVIEGREETMFQVYRWAPNIELNVDNFKVIKK